MTEYSDEEEDVTRDAVMSAEIEPPFEDEFVEGIGFSPFPAPPPPVDRHAFRRPGGAAGQRRQFIARQRALLAERSNRHGVYLVVIALVLVIIATVLGVTLDKKEKEASYKPYHRTVSFPAPNAPPTLSPIQPVVEETPVPVDSYPTMPPSPTPDQF